MNRLCLFAFSSFVLMIGAAQAQLSSSSDEPIDITSETAEFQDQVAVWTGNVRVVQAEAILTAERIEANLSEEGEFKSLTAIGSVRYSNGQEAITGARADYDEKTRAITISDDVIVTQGKQVMSAGAVVYWIDTGKVKFIPEAGKRIRGIFYTNDNEES